MLWGREASALKCYQFSLALQSGHNHTSYYSYNYKIAFTVFFKENSKLSFEERGFSKAAFQRTPTQTSLLIPFTEKKKDSSQHQCRKLLKPEKKFSDSGWRYNFCNLAQTKCQLQRFTMLEKSNEKLTLNFKD